MPPPSHVHPGLLVTNKPDLPRPQSSSPPAVGPACSRARGSNGTADKYGPPSSWEIWTLLLLLLLLPATKPKLQSYDDLLFAKNF